MDDAWQKRLEHIRRECREFSGDDAYMEEGCCVFCGKFLCYHYGFDMEGNYLVCADCFQSIRSA